MIKIYLTYSLGWLAFLKKIKTIMLHVHPSLFLHYLYMYLCFLNLFISFILPCHLLRVIPVYLAVLHVLVFACIPSLTFVFPPFTPLSVFMFIFLITRLHSCSHSKERSRTTSQTSMRTGDSVPSMIVWSVRPKILSILVLMPAQLRLTSPSRSMLDPRPTPRRITLKTVRWNKYYPFL